MISQAPGALCSQYEDWLCNLENGRLEHLFEIILWPRGGVVGHFN